VILTQTIRSSSTNFYARLPKFRHDRRLLLITIGFATDVTQWDGASGGPLGGPGAASMLLIALRPYWDGGSKSGICFSLRHLAYKKCQLLMLCESTAR